MENAQIIMLFISFFFPVEGRPIICLMNKAPLFILQIGFCEVAVMVLSET